MVSAKILYTSVVIVAMFQVFFIIPEASGERCRSTYGGLTTYTHCVHGCCSESNGNPCCVFRVKRSYYRPVLSVGQIIGITFGVLLFLICCCLRIFCICQNSVSPA